jgi:xanthine dehydrogenase accessory factor
MVEKNEIRLWRFVADKLIADGRVALLTVTADEKGSPGKKGFKMALSADADSSGTIGGGIMEYSLKEQYTERLQRGEVIRDIRMLVHAQHTKRGEPSGLTCAGSQIVCVLSLGRDDIPAVRSIIRSLEDSGAAHMIVSDAGLVYGEGRSPDQMVFVQSSASRWMHTENLGPEYTVFIVGGGHVGHALSRIMATLSMSVVVYDERAGMPMLEDNPYADRKITDAYATLGAYIQEPAKTFAAIVTSDYSTDAVAVRQLLPLGLPYIGIMGVEAKIARIKNSLDEDDRIRFESQAVHAPIGLPIGSSTAEEIAVSIAAEIIAVKNRIAQTRTAPITDGAL